MSRQANEQAANLMEKLTRCPCNVEHLANALPIFKVRIHGRERQVTGGEGRKKKEEAGKGGGREGPWAPATSLTGRNSETQIHAFYTNFL